MLKRKLYSHYLILLGVILFGAVLRFWNLDLKPLWMDEVITSIFSLGKNYNDLPLDRVFYLTNLTEIFTYQSGRSCAQIAGNLASQSTHPPLFFCTMYTALGWLQGFGGTWVEKLRAIPALFGVGSIFVIYWVNRVAFSPKAGLAAAGCMAISPFAVYLSQEARHYTLPMFLVSLALLLLIQIQQDIFQHQRVRVWKWVFWVVVNSIALYVHYFCLLALIAQIGTIAVVIAWRCSKLRSIKKYLISLSLSTITIAIIFLPWLMVMLHHSKRSETDWLNAPQHIAPFYQTVINWVLMVIAFPVENQPIINAVVCGFFMVFCSIWIGKGVFKGLKKLLLKADTQLSTLTLLSFSIWVILEFLGIIYLLGKDITVVPRYNFIYYPSFCALIAASLVELGIVQVEVEKTSWHILSTPPKSARRMLPPTSSPYPHLFTVLIVGAISCVFLIFNLVFQKPFQPELVAKNMNQDPLNPVMIVVGYSDYQDVALGLSFALALQQLQNKNQISGKQSLNSPSPRVAFLSKQPNFQLVLDKLAQQSPLETPSLNLWVVASGLRKRDFPEKIMYSSQTTCHRDVNQYYRIGIPYQLYRC